MTTPPQPNPSKIPEEILRSEARQASPIQTPTPGIMGLPGLPANILDLIIQYGPFLVLAAGAFGLIGAIGNFINLTSSPGYLHGAAALGASFLGLGASAAMIGAYIWLKQSRRVGWNTLAFALIAQFLSQIIITGVSSILFTGMSMLITAYVMLQIRDSYSA